ncbi:MAG TPA: heavy-metal-associated domain-containing protein [Candidatus Nanopelagicaceae bacterium]|nr:heavy-metal-associated domain-containing protein [Candidatus Nanopelagicaceae bacterium]
MSLEMKYGITGMTCGHCVHAVTEEVSAITGVRDVKINLVEGGQSLMTLTADSDIHFKQVSEAVNEAGNYVAVAL